MAKCRKCNITISKFEQERFDSLCENCKFYDLKAKGQLIKTVCNDCGGNSWHDLKDHEFDRKYFCVVCSGDNTISELDK